MRSALRERLKGRPNKVVDELMCADCGNVVDVCCFCESEACDCAVCYTCLVTRLGESRPHPHDHGG